MRGAPWAAQEERAVVEWSEQARLCDAKPLVLAEAAGVEEEQLRSRPGEGQPVQSL